MQYSRGRKHDQPNQASVGQVILSEIHSRVRLRRFEGRHNPFLRALHLSKSSEDLGPRKVIKLSLELAPQQQLGGGRRETSLPTLHEVRQ